MLASLPARHVAERTNPGDVRSVVVTGFFTEPWDYPESRVAWDLRLAQFIKQEEKDGWRFERVLSLGKDPIPTFNPDGEGRQTYILRCLFSRPAQRLVVELPDTLGDWLVKKNPKRFQYAGAARP